MSLITIITPQLKDELLVELLATSKYRYEIDCHELAPSFNTKPFILHIMLQQFAELGLIDYPNDGRGYGKVTIRAKAHDFYLHGGFAVQEEILKANIEKLGRELEVLAASLTPDLADKAAELSSIGANILTALAAVCGK